MQVTTNMLNNKVNLSKINAQFASDSYDKVNNPLSDEAKAKLEVIVKDGAKNKAEAKLEDKVKYEVNDEAKDIAKFKLEVLVTCIKDLGDAMEAYLDKSNECADTIDESNNLLSDEEKVKVKTEKVENLKLEAAKSVLEFVEDTIELARKIINGSTSALEMTLIMAVDVKRMADKREEIVEDVTNAIEDAQITKS